MQLTEVLFISILLHFVGDYLLQNNWMANEKIKSFLPALIHATIYSLPFFILTNFSPLILIILITHFFIDRYRLAVYWIKLVNWNWSSDNLGYSAQTPKWLSTWLMIIIDNTFHILINTIVIKLIFLLRSV